MSEDLLVISGTKAEKYEALLPQISALVSGESDLIANLANITGALKEQFMWLWVGFYLVKEDQLVLGPFQGPLACVTIPFDKGVCGAAATGRKTVIVADVDAFPGHIACSSLSKSEIVVPLVAGGETKLVLDVDSDRQDDFGDVDRLHLERVVALIAAQHF